jgi:hypothetical protein
MTLNGGRTALRYTKLNNNVSFLLVPDQFFEPSAGYISARLKGGIESRISRMKQINVPHRKVNAPCGRQPLCFLIRVIRGGSSEILTIELLIEPGFNWGVDLFF